MTKTERQEIAALKWRDAKGKGSFNFVPRFGKTRCAKNIIERTLSKDKKAVIVAVVPNDITQKNLIANLPKEVIVVTRMKLINSFQEYRDLDIKLLVVDEIHRFLDKNGLMILELEAKFKLGLTGSKLSSSDKLDLARCGFPVIDTITEDEALMYGWIADFVEYNLPVEIEEHKKELYVGYSTKINDILTLYKGHYKKINTKFGTKVIDSDLDLMYALYGGKSYQQQGGYAKQFIKADIFRQVFAECMGWTVDIDLSIPHNQKINDYFNPSVLYENAKLFSFYVKERTELISNSKNKIEAVLNIVKLNPVSSIIFNETTSMATLITNSLGNEAIEYHSRVESKYLINPDTGQYVCHANGNPIKFGATRLKKFAIEGMKQGLFKYLVTVKALNEGIDIPNLQQVILTGGTINPNDHLQRVARGKTICEDIDNKVTTIINIYIKDFTYKDELIVSRDASKLKQRQKDTFVYWVDSIDEIFVDVE